MNEKRVKFHLRLLADFIDIFTAMLFGIVIALLLTDLVIGSGNMLTEAKKFSPQAQYIINIVFSVFIVLYFFVEAVTGFTAGKFLIRIKIANEDGTKAEPKTYMIRYLIKNFGLIIIVIGSISGFTILGQIGGGLLLLIIIGTVLSVRDSRQAIHDAYPKTALFRVSDLKKLSAQENNNEDAENSNEDSLSKNEE